MQFQTVDGFVLLMDVFILVTILSYAIWSRKGRGNN